jgi:hypothetical protein
MKTAMQELIERLKRNIEEMPNEKNQFTQGYKSGLSFVIECATNSLEKEKEQIVHSGNTCAIKAILYKEKLDEMCENELIEEVTKNTITHGEDYYNQTFNQNK